MYEGVSAACDDREVGTESGYGVRGMGIGGESGVRPPRLRAPLLLLQQPLPPLLLPHRLRVILLSSLFRLMVMCCVLRAVLRVSMLQLSCLRGDVMSERSCLGISSHG
eukprot:1451518-Rhodomonas_salina.2